MGASKMRTIRSRGAVLGALGSALLHMALIDFMVGGGGSGARVPRMPGLGAATVVSDESSAMTLILLDGTAVDGSEDEFEQSASSRGTALQSVQLTVITPSPVREPGFKIDTDEESAQQSTEQASADTLGRAKQFGLYMGQIQARIERAWLRPRTPIGADNFECTVQIHQSPRGEVLEVALRRCNGDARWQISLVQAIERASPLPAPPDPVVFTESFRLSFQSRPFESRDGHDGFEPERVLLTRDAPPPLRLQE
jgi:hypothetical protein